MLPQTIFEYLVVVTKPYLNTKIHYSFEPYFTVYIDEQYLAMYR